MSYSTTIIPTNGQGVVEVEGRANIPAPPYSTHKAPFALRFIRRDATDGSGIPQHVEAIKLANAELIKGYPYYETPERIHRFIVEAQRCSTDLIARSNHKGVAEGEADIAGKLSIVRRRAPGFFIADHNPHGLSKAQLPSLFVKLFDTYVTKLAPDFSKPWADTVRQDVNPLDTNHGAPFFDSEPGHRLAALQAMAFGPNPTLASINKRLSALAAATGADPLWFQAAAVNRRMQPTAKPSRGQMVVGGMIQQSAAYTGMWARTRLVYMMPFWVNLMVTPVSLPLKQARLLVPGFGHDAVGTKAYLPLTKQWKYTYENDMSAFDTSITPVMRGLFWDALGRAGAYSTALDLLRQYDESTSVVSPSWEGVEGEASIYSGPTGLLSGLKLTTEVGSAVSACATVYALVKVGVLSEADALAGRWPTFLMLGDDVLFGHSSKVDTTAFGDAIAEVGLKAKAVEGNRFLMKHTVDGKQYAVACRVLQQTVSNEDSYSHLGHVLVGLAGRLSAPLWPSHVIPVRDFLLQWLDNASPSDPMLALSGEPGSWSGQLLRHPAAISFIASAPGQAWITDLAARADSSSVAADLVALLGPPDDASLQKAQNVWVDALTSSKPSRASIELIAQHLS